jgi:hypothetical protein
MRIRLKPQIRKEKLIKIAVDIAAIKGGWASFTRKQISDTAKCSEALISMHFSTMDNLREEILKKIILESVYCDKHLSVIGQAIANGDLQAEQLPFEVKIAALNTLAR